MAMELPVGQVHATIKHELDVLGVLDRDNIQYFEPVLETETTETTMYRNASRIMRLAAQNDLWDLAEIAALHPDITSYGPFEFLGGKSSQYYYLGKTAAQSGDNDRARSYFAKAELDPSHAEAEITHIAINQGRSGDAAERLLEVDFSVLDGSEAQMNLGRLVDLVSNQDGEPVAALKLIDLFVPKPNLEDRTITHQRALYDWFLEPIAPAALQQKDFVTAEEAIERTNDWFGPGAAMGGGGLLDATLEKDDPNVSAATWALILRKWGNGNALQELPQLVEQLDADIKTKIGDWLLDTKARYQAGFYPQPFHETFPPKLDEVIALFPTSLDV